MKNEILELIHDISIKEESSIIGALFGYEDLDVKEFKNFSYVFQPTDNLEADVYLMLKYILINILSHSNIPRIKQTVYNNQTIDLGKDNYDLSNYYKIYDLENHLDEMYIDYSMNGYVMVKLKLALYNY